jgi:hypothetical protein
MSMEYVISVSSLYEITTRTVGNREMKENETASIIKKQRMSKYTLAAFGNHMVLEV